MYKVSFKDVVLAYLLQDIPGVQNEIVRGASEDTVLRALNNLRAENHPCDSLFMFCQETYDAEIVSEANTGRGRSVIQTGETREVKVQHPQSQPYPFVRLNVQPMGLGRNDKVEATLNDDGSMTLRPV